LGVPWPATDGLGRPLPTHEEVGAPRPDRFVAVFYFLWLGQHGDAGPFDNTKILAADPAALTKPDSPLWGPVGAPHYWGEPLFGYYVSDDDAVLAKHAQMLDDAGVDVVIFDASHLSAFVAGTVPRVGRDSPARRPHAANRFSLSVR
jgi:hypothetical protein